MNYNLVKLRYLTLNVISHNKEKLKLPIFAVTQAKVCGSKAVIGK